MLIGREAWRIKVRVVRMWGVPTFLKPDQTNSIEMVLIDEKGGKIHATIRKQLLYVFQHKLTEGEVYKMSYFSVAPSSGAYRTTLHPYKLIFQMKTKVQSCENTLIPCYGLSLCNISKVCSQSSDYDHLVDVIGLMTGISPEREYVRDGKVTKMVVFELTDHSGKCECALFGEYVDILQKLMGKSIDGMHVVIVQFAKIKIFRDKASIQNVMNATRILVNPPIEEAIEFRNGLAIHGVEPSGVIPVLGPRARPSMEEEFLRMYPKKTIVELNGMVEDGTFVVCAIVNGLVDGQDWWYPSCKCHKSVTPDSGAYYCKGCDKHVFHMVPRYKVKLEVSDGNEEAIFVLFDGDVQYLIDKQCATLVSAAKAENAGFYPSELTNLKGMKLLFKVEKNSANHLFDGSYRVKRVCSEASVVETFSSGVCSYTSTEAIYQTPLSGDVDLVENSIICEDTQTKESVSDIITTPPSVICEVQPSNVSCLDDKLSCEAVDYDVVDLDEECSLTVAPSIHAVKPRRLKKVTSAAKRNLLDAFDEAGAKEHGQQMKTVKIEKE